MENEDRAAFEAWAKFERSDLDLSNGGRDYHSNQTHQAFRIWVAGADAWQAKVEASLRPVAQAAKDVVAERQRQIDVEGRSKHRDDMCTPGELSSAAGALALAGSVALFDDKALIQARHPTTWPWGQAHWPGCPTRLAFVKAAALLLAEIERLDRADGDQ